MPKKKKDNLTYEPEQLDNGLEKELKKYEKRSFKMLTDQVETECQLSWWFMKPKFDEWGLRLKLHNNQKRDKKAIGDPLLFTILQTVLASLYDDKLSVEFLPRERGDEDIAENLTLLSDFDYSEMQKNIIDYDWSWDAGFFGRGLLDLREFDRTLKIPIPEVLDPMTVLRDPRAKSVNGDIKGRNACRFIGREIRLTKNEMKMAGTYFNLDKLKKSDSTNTKSLTDENERLRKDAQGYDNLEGLKSLTGENQEFRLLEWFTFWRGKRVLVVLANDRKTVVRFLELPDWKIPIIDRTIYPMPHDWDGVSIPDLIEDKQRARSVIQNLGLKGVKAGLNPMYLFNADKIKNKANLNFGFNKFIPVDGAVDGAIAEVPRSGIKQEANFILEILDTAAQKATATPDMQQGGMSKAKRTLGEINLIADKVDTRYSLSARIFGWSEKLFWLQWYKLYKRHFNKDIDDKVLRLSGALGAKWRELTHENIIANIDPDVKIESKVIATAKRLQELQGYQNYVNLALSYPTANKLFALRKLGKLSGIDKNDIEHILPPTIDEIRAEEENEALLSGDIIPVSPIDDHPTHQIIHNKLPDDLPAKYAHIRAHQKFQLKQKERPELFPEQQEDEEVFEKPKLNFKYEQRSTDTR